MKTPDSAFECALFLPRQRLTRDWALDACELLWRHGMRLLSPDQVVGDWNEQVRVAPSQQPFANGSLSDQIDEIVRQEHGAIVCYDRTVEFHVRFDLNLQETPQYYELSPEQMAAREQLRLGKLVISINYPDIASWQRIKALPADQAPATAYLLPPYEQAHLAMAHWVELLCTNLHPAFAVGYYATNSYATTDSFFIREFDVAVVTALQSGVYPPLGRWLDQVYLLYAPQQLMAPALVEEWLATPGRWSRRLAGGGWLAYSMPETYDTTLYEEYYTAAQAILKDMSASNNRARVPEARAYIQRAQQLAAFAQPPRQGVSILESQLEYLERQP